MRMPSAAVRSLRAWRRSGSMHPVPGDQCMTATPDQRRSRRPATVLPIPERVVKRSLKDAAYDRLRAAILSGELAAGSRVIPADLAASLGISRTPVLQAME